MIRTAPAEDLEIMVHTGLVVVNSHSKRSNGFQKIEVNRRLLAHANHILHILNGKFTPKRFRYELALQVKELSTIFQTNRIWIHSPLVTFWLNVFQVHNPNLDKEAECLEIVISMCKYTEDQKFKDLHRDALGRLSGVFFARKIFHGVKNGWLENNACRASSHPTEWICSRCLQNLHTDILPIPLFLILLLWGIIMMTWIALSLPFKNQISAISSQLSNLLVFSVIPRWKYRRTAFVLGIFGLIGDTLYNWYVLETDWMILVCWNHLRVIFGNLPVLYLTEGVSLIQLSGLSLHLERENSLLRPENSRLESGNSRLESAFSRMAEDVRENAVTAYWVSIVFLLIYDLCLTLQMIL